MSFGIFNCRFFVCHVDLRHTINLIKEGVTGNTFKSQTHMHTCIHTYVHTHIHTYIHTYIHTHIYTHKHTYTTRIKVVAVPAMKAYCGRGGINPLVLNLDIRRRCVIGFKPHIHTQS